MSMLLWSGRIEFLKQKLKMMAEPKAWSATRNHFGPSDAADLFAYIEKLELEVETRAAP